MFNTSDESLSPVLQRFAEALNVAFLAKAQVSQPVVSGARIPITFSDEHKIMMKQSNESRLMVEDGVAQLIPDQSVACTDCESYSWSLPLLARECTVITEKDLFNAKGMLFLYIECTDIYTCIPVAL